MIGDALVQADQIVRKIAECGRAREQRDRELAAQLRDGAPHPIERRIAVDARGRVAEEAPAELRRLVAEDDAGAGVRCGECGGEPGRTASHHQQIAVRVALCVAIGVGQRGRHAQARGASNRRLVPLLPGALRPHESLVVKTRREERRQPVVDPARRHVRDSATGSGSSPAGPRTAPPGWPGGSAYSAPRRDTP